MADQLSGVAIIIFIAFGVLTFLLLFIFANRQIKRFSLKSRGGPHAPIAGDTSKVLQSEIDRRLDVIRCISYQPKLLKKHEEKLFDNKESEISNVSPTLYRMKALDSLHTLESAIISTDPVLGRLFGQNLRLCLIRFFQKGLFRNMEISTLHRFSDLYEFARHEPGEFMYDSFVQIKVLQEEIHQSISQSDSRAHQNNSSSSSGSKQHLEVPSPALHETTRHLSNGEISSPPNTEEPDSPPQEPQEEKKATYETSV